MPEDKMAELKIEAPLAKFEAEDEWVDYQGSMDNPTLDGVVPPPVDNAAFLDTYSQSLEDLVNTFDEKITRCFRDYGETVEDVAPTIIRSQDELINECQMWWTLTGNYGNILPIDWSKSYSRKLHLPTLNLNEKTDPEKPLDVEEDDAEELAKDLDLHALILSSLQQEPMFTAEEVLEEIDEIMQESPSEDVVEPGEVANKPPHTLQLRGKAAIHTPLYAEKLRSLSLCQLNELYVELEGMIRELSETLISELALRDELEYEKELKNTFISLLLGVQNRRRHVTVEKRRRGPTVAAAAKLANGVEPKYLTTVIPYHTGMGPPAIQTLQVLIKILQAINEDSPTVPTLLTDYILKVLCPT